MNNNSLTDTSTPIIQAEGISKEYTTGEQPLVVLNNASLSIEKGEFITISGASGAGKSTLLHILGALDRPSKGDVLIHGTSLYSLSDRSRARIRNKTFGFVFQFYHLMPEFTALENVLLPAMVERRDLKNARKTGMQLLSDVGLAKRMFHYPNQLSGGEQQRVAIARALLNEPDVLFADEPTGNLDSTNSDKIISMLCKLHESHSFAFIMVTHNRELAQMGTRQFYLDNGILTCQNKSQGTHE